MEPVVTKKLVDFSVTMRPLARASMSPFDHEGSEIGIAITPIRPGSLPGVDPKHLWAWAVVQKTPGQPDKFLVGKTSDSQTGAAAAAFEEFERLKAIWLRTKAEGPPDA